MQISYTHKLSMHKVIFLKIRTFAPRFERLRLKQIFWNFKIAFLKVFAFLKLLFYISFFKCLKALKFCAQAIFNWL